MTIDTQRLKDLASKASPGPWRNGADPSHFDAPEVTDGKTFAYWVTKDEDAAFIAAISPDVCVALLDEIERLRALLPVCPRCGDDCTCRLVDSWMAIAHGEAVALQEQLAAMTAARDEACELAERHIFAPDIHPSNAAHVGPPQSMTFVSTIDSGAPYRDKARIAALRTIGSPK